MRARVRAAYSCRVGKTPSDDRRRGWLETVKSHLAHKRSNGLAGCSSGRLAATSPRLFACGAALSELLVVRVHGLSNPRVGQVDLVAQYDLRRLERPRENDHDGPPRMHPEPETSGTSWERHRLDDACATRCAPLPVHGARLRGQYVFPPRPHDAINPTLPGASGGLPLGQFRRAAPSTSSCADSLLPLISQKTAIAKRMSERPTASRRAALPPSQAGKGRRRMFPNLIICASRRLYGRPQCSESGMAALARELLPLLRGTPDDQEGREIRLQSERGGPS